MSQTTKVVKTQPNIQTFTPPQDISVPGSWLVDKTVPVLQSTLQAPLCLQPLLPHLLACGSPKIFFLNLHLNCLRLNWGSFLPAVNKLSCEIDGTCLEPRHPHFQGILATRPWSFLQWGLRSLLSERLQYAVRMPWSNFKSINRVIFSLKSLINKCWLNNAHLMFAMICQQIFSFSKPCLTITVVDNWFGIKIIDCLFYWWKWQDYIYTPLYIYVSKWFNLFATFTKIRESPGCSFVWAEVAGELSANCFVTVINVACIHYSHFPPPPSVVSVQNQGWQTCSRYRHEDRRSGYQQTTCYQVTIYTFLLFSVDVIII